MSTPLAFQQKDPGPGMVNVTRNQAIQAARDSLTCGCGHLNVSHGYGYRVDTATWPDGSRIGMGPCGFGSCTCEAFRAVRG